MVNNTNNHLSINVLPNELLYNVFTHLNPKDREVCAKVCQRWQEVASDETFKYPEMAFGADKWKKFGDVGKEPPLPLNINAILKQDCPVSNNGQKVKDTHMLVLIPETLNGKPFTLNQLQNNTITSQETHYFNSEVMKEFGEEKVVRSYWALMTKNILLDTIGIQHEERIEKAKNLGNYTIPSVLEVATCVFATRAQSDKAVFTNHSNPTTFCQEVIRSDKTLRVVVRNDSDKVNLLYSLDLPHWNIGTAAVMKFE